MPLIIVTIVMLSNTFQVWSCCCFAGSTSVVWN